MEKLAKVTGIAAKAERDGANVIEITQPNGETLEASIDLETAQTIVRILQPRLVAWADNAVRNLALPQLDVNDFDVAHAGHAAELMAHTDQLGVLVLRMKDATLKKCAHEIDRVLTYRSGPPVKQ
jgi:hypothetical protein